MNEGLYSIVKGCRRNNEECLEKIYNMFLPLLKKYSNSFFDKDDAFDELGYSLTLCLLYQMPLENERFRNDGVIVSYIVTTIRNRYYLLCKRESKSIKMICNYDDLQLEQTNKDSSSDDEVLLLSLKNYLTESEI